MKNICFLIGNLNNSGGTERVTSLIANGLSEQADYEVSILNFFDGTHPAFAINSEISLFSLFNKKKSMQSMFLVAIFRIRKFIIEHNIDTLIVVDSISCVFTVPALFGLKVNHICWEHFNFLNNNGSRFRDIGRKLAAKYCDTVITLTNRDKGLWKHGLQKISSNLICIPNPTPFKSNAHIPQKSFKMVLAAGRLTYVKGFDFLLEAWAIVCKDNDDWILQIAGGGEEDQKLRALSKSLNIDDRVIFLGQKNNIEEYYKESSFFCLTSRNEGLPMVLLEAQSFGLPIVAFDCDTGPSEIIEHNKTGLLVNNGDIKDLSLKLLQIMNIKDEDFILMSRLSLEKSKQFNVCNILKKWVDIV